MAWIASFWLACFVLVIFIIVVDFCIKLYERFSIKELLMLGGFIIALITITIILHHVIFVME